MPMGNFQCRLIYYVLGRRFQRTGKAVLINILLDIELAKLFMVASRCSGITGRVISTRLCLMCVLALSLLCCSVSQPSDEIISETLLWRVKSLQTNCAAPVGPVRVD